MLMRRRPRRRAAVANVQHMCTSHNAVILISHLSPNLQRQSAKIANIKSFDSFLKTGFFLLINNLF